MREKKINKIEVSIGENQGIGEDVEIEEWLKS